MKHNPFSPIPMVSVSDAAMERARRAMSKVAYSSAENQQITHAAQKLPDVAVMAGRQKPSVAALRRAVASSTALETGQSVQELEQKLKDTANRRFAHIKLAP